MKKEEEQRKRLLFAILAIFVALGIGGFFLFTKGTIEFKTHTPSTSNDETARSETDNASTTEPEGKTTQTNTSLSGTKRVRVLAPNGGEVWYRNKQYLVRWDTNLSDSATARVYLLSTSKVLSNPYADPGVTGTEMFVQAMFPKGYPQEGTYTYKVPQSLPAGRYQLLILAGQDCKFSFPKPVHVCDYDFSDGLITVK